MRYYNAPLFKVRQRFTGLGRYRPYAERYADLRDGDWFRFTPLSASKIGENAYGLCIKMYTTCFYNVEKRIAFKVDNLGTMYVYCQDVSIAHRDSGR